MKAQGNNSLKDCRQYKKNKIKKEVTFMKKKWLSRLVATMLSGIMATGMLTGCGEQQEVGSANTETQIVESVATATETEVAETELTYPVDTDVELRMYCLGLKPSSAYVDASESPFHTGLSERTGIKVNWEYPVEGADNNSSYNLMLQEEELPHIIYSGKANVAHATQLLADGLIYDLTDYIPKYAPDYWEYINRPENAESLKALKTESGQLYSIAAMRESEYNITYLGPVIRQDWLNECGLEKPVTLEDWEKVLVAFKDKYNATLGFPLGRFNTGGGFASGTDAHAALTLNWYVDEDGKVQCANSQEEWKEFLEVFHRWYDMGLIDPDFATAGDSDVRAKALNGEIGAAFTAMSQLTNFITDATAENTGAEWVGVSYARTAPGEPTKYIYTDRQLYSMGFGAMISTSCSEEELIAALQFLNYGYTEEGIMYWNYGTEGETYTVDANGEVQFTELVTADEQGLGEALKKYTGTSGSGITVQLAHFVQIKNNPVSAAAVYEWIDNTEAAAYVLPSLAYSDDDTLKYNDITSAMKTYVAEMALKFVTGDESLDNFDKFVEELNEYGMAEVLEIMQGGYESYLER